MKEQIKNWLIKKLSGYTKLDVEREKEWARKEAGTELKERADKMFGTKADHWCDKMYYHICTMHLGGYTIDIEENEKA